MTNPDKFEFQKSNLGVYGSSWIGGRVELIKARGKKRRREDESGWHCRQGANISRAEVVI